MVRPARVNLLLTLGAIAAVPGAGAQTPLPDPTVDTLASGVFVIHNPRANESFQQGNTLVVAGSNATLVLDAAYLPITARADIALIRHLTRTPVRYVVLSHWHYDHTNGIGEYDAAFPEVGIIAHPETRRLLEDNAPRYIASVLAPGSPQRRSVETSARALAAMDSGGDTTDRAVIKRRNVQRRLELDELARVRFVLPNSFVTSERHIDLGGREVIVRFAGRANTPGDLMVFLPRDRIVATGDVVVSPIPYAYSAIPSTWVAALETLLAMPVDIIVPGHGDVLRRRSVARDSLPWGRSFEFVSTIHELAASVVQHVRKAYREGLTVEQARASIDFAPYRARFAGDDAFLRQVFDNSIVTALVDRAWAEAQGLA